MWSTGMGQCDEERDSISPRDSGSNRHHRERTGGPLEAMAASYHRPIPGDGASGSAIASHAKVVSCQRARVNVSRTSFCHNPYIGGFCHLCINACEYFYGQKKDTRMEEMVHARLCLVNRHGGRQE